MSETIGKIKEEILVHKESINELQEKLAQEEQRVAERQRLFAIARKGASIDNEALGRLAKEVSFWDDVIVFLSDNNFITVDRVFNQPPHTIKKATIADILCLFIKDKPDSKEGGK
ncbi:MAG: hypothetical protein M0Z71_05155 [Nitrospiraceae bacterium]|nr:hypothetical protein [Nitrospiraceae bacterium]